MTYAVHRRRCPLCGNLIVYGLQAVWTQAGWAHSGCLVNAAKKLDTVNHG